jgi:hypothetical protein
VRTHTLTVPRLILAGCLVSLAVFAGTWAWLTRGAGPAPRRPAPAGVPPRLAFQETVWPHDPADPDARADYEWRRPGHHDFAFRAGGDGPVRVWLTATGCACTRVELGIDTAEGSTTWQVLRREDADGLTVPARASGAVRVSWRGEELGPKRLTAELRTASGEGEGTPITLEVPVNFVPPVRVAPEESLEEPPDGEIKIGALGPGDTRTIRLIAWSSTRDQFALKPKAPADPHITCGPPERLGKAECARLERGHDTTVRCAYRVPVTVRERTADGQELDLGPLSRQLEFVSDPDIETVVVSLGGSARGPVTVGDDADRGELSLGTFERGAGTSAAITLSTEERGLDLQVESAPEFIQARLREEKPRGSGGRAWRLTVTVPPDSLIGSIPPHTAVLLRTTGDRPRRIRIPATGSAYVK